MLRRGPGRRPAVPRRFYGSPGMSARPPLRREPRGSRSGWIREKGPGGAARLSRERTPCRAGQHARTTLPGRTSPLPRSALLVILGPGSLFEDGPGVTPQVLQFRLPGAATPRKSTPGSGGSPAGPPTSATAYCTPGSGPGPALNPGRSGRSMGSSPGGTPKLGEVDPPPGKGEEGVHQGAGAVPRFNHQRHRGGALREGGAGGAPVHGWRGHKEEAGLVVIAVLEIPGQDGQAVAGGGLLRGNGRHPGAPSVSHLTGGPGGIMGRHRPDPGVGAERTGRTGPAPRGGSGSPPAPRGWHQGAPSACAGWGAPPRR